MTDLLKEIIATDQAARARVAEAQQAQAEAYASIAAQKQALILEKKAKAQRQAEEIGKRRRIAGEGALAAVRADNETILNRMNALYAENGGRWVSEIVAAVLAAED